MRDLNTVRQKSVEESKRDVRMGSPRPSYGRARNYGTQGRNEYGRLGGLGIGPNYLNSYKHPEYPPKYTYRINEHISLGLYHSRSG